jgi:predicted RNA methylase
MNAMDRLLCLQANNDEAGVRMLAAEHRFKMLAGRHENGTAPKAISAFNLFQTPRPIAARMAEIVKAHVEPGARILEPSFGLGRLYEPFADIEGLRERWVAVENAGECVRAVVQALRRIEIQERDFLATRAEELGGQFDAAIMNPPFKQGTDVRHIKHALGMVRAGGILVSLCYNGVKQNAELKGIATTWEVLPEGSFRSEGTDASVVLMTVRK